MSSEGWTVAEEEETRSVRSPEEMAWEANAAAMAYEGEGGRKGVVAAEDSEQVERNGRERQPQGPRSPGGSCDAVTPRRSSRSAPFSQPTRLS